MAELNSILIVGCGNMGGAMLAGWLAAGLDPARFTVVDPLLEAAPAGVALLREMPHGHFDAILIGTKPQSFDAVAPAIEPLAGAETLVISIMAGVDLDPIGAKFARARAVVRAMPNLAAALGKSPLALTGSRLDPPTRDAVDRLFAPLGTPEWFADDSLFDALTALVGSGPAFVYRFIDALAKGAEAIGLAPGEARRLALTMIESASALASKSLESPDKLAKRVTSPGGTTAAGLAVLDSDAALARLVAATLRAARDRGAELAEAARGQSSGSA